MDNTLFCAGFCVTLYTFYDQFYPETVTTQCIVVFCLCASHCDGRQPPLPRILAPHSSQLMDPCPQNIHTTLHFNDDNIELMIAHYVNSPRNVCKYSWCVFLYNILFSWGTVLGCFVKDFLPTTLFFSSVRLFIRARVKGSMSSKININSQNQNF